MSDPQTFRLPNLCTLFASVAPNYQPSPHYLDVRPQSRAWIDQYDQYSCGPKMRAFLDACDFELFASYVYPRAEPERLKTAMDLMSYYWRIDESTDIQNGLDAKESAVIVTRALKESGFDDGTWLCRMSKSFYQLHVVNFGPNTAQRFIRDFCDYIEGVAQEAFHRETDEILDIPRYLALRRRAVAVRPSFDALEYCLGLDLPHHVYEDPTFKYAYQAACDVILWTNDLISWNMEQAKGHAAANVITVVMKSKGLDVQRAVDFAGGYLEALIDQWAEGKRILSGSLDPVYSTDAVKFLDGLGEWMRGHYEWSFVTPRYFGKESLSVKKHRVVQIKTSFEDTVRFDE